MDKAILVKKRKLVTISYNYPAELMKEVTKNLKEAEYDVREDGSPTDPEGHCIQAYLDDEQVMFAMTHSNGNSYILKAIDGLLT